MMTVTLYKDRYARARDNVVVVVVVDIAAWEGSSASVDVMQHVKTSPAHQIDMLTTAGNLQHQQERTARRQEQ